MKWTIAFLFLASFVFAEDKLVDGIDLLNLPKAQTEITTKQLIKGKTTPGDLILLEVTPTEPDVMPKMSEELSKAPVEWGSARILWWKLGEVGKILVGLTSYTPGSLDIKPIPFVSKNNPNKPIFATQPLTLQIEAVEGDAEKDDIYPPSKIAFPKWVVAGIAGSILPLILLGLWLYSRLKKKNPKTAEALAQPLLNPIEEYQRARNAIESFHFLDKGNYKAYYFGFSEAAKRFLGRAYHCDSEDKTTRELMELLREIGMGDDLRALWKMILDEMDIIKFTDKKPEPEAADNLATRISQIVSTSWTFSPANKELQELSRRK